MSSKKEKARLLEKFRRLGISPAEVQLMATLLYHPRLLDDLAGAAQFEHRGDILEQSYEVYEQAVESCLKNGWAKMVTEEEHQAQATLAASQLQIMPCVDEWVVAEAGVIDLTTVGYRIYRMAAAEQFGPARNGLREVVLPALHLEVYSDSESDCHDFAEVVNHEEHPFNVGRETVRGTLDGIFGPRPVGPWRYNRFEVIPQGFLMTLQYTRKM